MRPGGSTKVAAAPTTVSEVKVRKSLHSLQPAATDKENLVGAGRKFGSTIIGKQGIRIAMSDKIKGDTKKTNDKTVNVKTDSKKASDKVKTDSKKVQKDGKKEGRIFKSVAVQTETTEKTEVTCDDLTSETGSSEGYYKILTERRTVRLQNALEENQRLSELLNVYKEMLDESRGIVEVLKDMIGEDRNDINNSLDDSRL